MAESEDPPGGWRALAPDLTPLRRHRDFRRLTAGRFITFFGSMVTFVAVPYQVYELTHSSLMVGLLGAVETVALLALAFWGGALADAVDRRRLVVRTEVGLMVCGAVLLVNASLAQPKVWVVFLAATASAGLGAVQRPALGAMAPKLVEPEELGAVSAIQFLTGTAAMILGPAVGGILIGGAGLEAAYLVDLVTFAISLVALWGVRAVPAPDDAERPSLARVLEGLRYARSRQELVGTYVIDMAAMFFGMPMALFPEIAERYGGSGTLGMLYAALPVGAFLATLTSGWTKRVHRHGRAVALAAGLWGAAIVVFGLAPWLWLALLGLVMAGFCDMVSGLFRMTMWNMTIPDQLRGRLASIELVSYTSGPLLGNTEAGAAAALVGLRPAIVSGGVLCVGAVAAAALALPAFWAYDDRAALSAASSEPPSRTS